MSTAFVSIRAVLTISIYVFCIACIVKEGWTLDFSHFSEEFRFIVDCKVLNCGVGEDSWESLGLQGDPTSPSLHKSVLNIHCKDWCWSWNYKTLATWCEELTHLKRPWCWERLMAGEGDDRGWDGWMASPTQWTWVWVDSRSWWWTGRPGLLSFMGSQRVGHDWVTELNLNLVNILSYFENAFKLYMKLFISGMHSPSQTGRLQIHIKRGFIKHIL